MSFGHVFHSIGQAVNNVVGDKASTIANKAGGAVHATLSNKTVDTLVPFAAVYTQKGRTNLLGTYGKVATGVLNSYTGGAAGQLAPSIFNVAGAVPGLLNAPEAPSPSGDGGGGGYGYQVGGGYGGMPTSSLVLYGVAAAALLIVTMLALRK